MMGDSEAINDEYAVCFWSNPKFAHMVIHGEEDGQGVIPRMRRVMQSRRKEILDNRIKHGMHTEKGWEEKYLNALKVQTTGFNEKYYLFQYHGSDGSYPFTQWQLNVMCKAPAWVRGRKCPVCSKDLDAHYKSLTGIPTLFSKGNNFFWFAHHMREHGLCSLVKHGGSGSNDWRFTCCCGFTSIPKCEEYQERQKIDYENLEHITQCPHWSDDELAKRALEL